MKKLLLLSLYILIVYALIYSCSAEEEDTSPPPVVVQPQEPELDPTQYTLTVTAGEGGTVSTEGGTYDEGTDVNIIATPDEGYEFIGWEGRDFSETSIIITLNSNLSLQASFRKLILNKIQISSPPNSLIVTQEYIPNIIATFDNGTTKDVTQSVKISSQNKKVTI